MPRFYSRASLRFWRKTLCFFLLMSLASACRPAVDSKGEGSELQSKRVLEIKNAKIEKRVRDVCPQEYISTSYDPDYYLNAINSETLREAYFLPLYFSLYDISWFENEMRPELKTLFPQLNDENLYFFADYLSGTFAFMAVFPDKVLLHFRGSSLSTPQSFITDFVAFTLPVLLEGVAGESFEVHQGFYNSSNKLLPKIIDAYHDKSRPIHISGHSLGGALATLSAFELSRQGYSVASVHTSGQPKVVNRAFARHIANQFKEKGINYVRLFHRDDVVSLFGKYAAKSLLAEQLYALYKKHAEEAYFDFVHLDSGMLFEPGSFEKNEDNLDWMEQKFWNEKADLKIFSQHSAEIYFCRILKHRNQGRGGFG